MVSLVQTVHSPKLEEKLGRSGRRGSVQAQFVGLRAIHDHVLCITSMSEGSHDYVNILQVEGISYDLKGEDEQRVINDLYQAFLCALPYSVQILWRILPLNMSDYLAQFHAEKENVPEHGIWKELAHAHQHHLGQLASQRTLLNRNIYLIVRVCDQAPEASSRFNQFLKPKRKKQQAQQVAKTLEKARQELDLRFSEITRLLTNMHLTVRRLSGPQELAPFYYSCLTPKKAQLYPLASEIVDGINRPIQTRHSWNLQTKKDYPTIKTRPEEDRESVQKDDGGKHTRSIDFAQLADVIAPAGVFVAPDLLKIENEFVRTIKVSHLPRIVSPGWLKPLSELDEPMEVSFHMQPISSSFMVQQFRRRQMEYQSSRMIAHRKGNEVDPDLKVAETDVDNLIDRLASGEERMLEVTMLVLVRGATKRELNERTERVLSVLHNMLLQSRVMLFEQDKGFLSALPHARNQFGQGILLDSRSASTMFPFLSNTLFHPEGILEGITPQGDPVVLDAWNTEVANANRMILGPPGWGKSHQVKTSILRMALKYTYAGKAQTKHQQQFQIIVIDPEREYGRMTAALGGQVIRLAPGSAHHINPFDLPTSAHMESQSGTPSVTHGDRLADHVQKMHTLLEIMLANRTPDQAGKLTSNEKGLLDRALYECYRKVGITSDVQTHNRAAPLMRDLYDVLESGVCGPDATGITQRLRRYVHGSLSGLFSSATDVALDNAVIVFDIHDMETELRPIGLFLVSNFVWTQSFQSTIPRQLIVDEAATLYQYESGALFLEDLVRRARKHYLGVTIISQHPVIFQNSAIPANCATHILMRQDSTSLDMIEQMFKLSSREVQLLRRLGIGEALLTTSDKRLHVRFESSELEHILATTDPRELAQWNNDPKHAHIQHIFQSLLSFDRLIAGEHPGSDSGSRVNKGDVVPQNQEKPMADKSLRVPSFKRVSMHSSSVIETTHTHVALVEGER